METECVIARTCVLGATISSIATWMVFQTFAMPARTTSLMTVMATEFAIVKIFAQEETTPSIPTGTRSRIFVIAVRWTGPMTPMATGCVPTRMPVRSTEIMISMAMESVATLMVAPSILQTMLTVMEFAEMSTPAPSILPMMPMAMGSVAMWTLAPSIQPTMPMAMESAVMSIPALVAMTTSIPTRTEQRISVIVVRWMLITTRTVTGCVPTSIPVPSMPITIWMAMVSVVT